MPTDPYGPSDPAKRHSAAITDGPDRAPARAMLKGTGFTDEDLAKPIIGVATTWIETMPCNLNQRELAVAREARRARRGRHADGAEHDLGVRRRLDGDRGHARVAGVARGDRRLDRAGRARPHVRRARLPGRLRQDDPGGGDGARAPRHPRARPLQRLDRAGPATGAATSPIQDVFEVVGAHAAGKVSAGGGPRARERRLPRRRRVRRPVHRQHDVDGARRARHQPGRA